MTDPRIQTARNIQDAKDFGYRIGYDASYVVVDHPEETFALLQRCLDELRAIAANKRKQGSGK